MDQELWKHMLKEFMMVLKTTNVTFVANHMPQQQILGAISRGFIVRCNFYSFFLKPNKNTLTCTCPHFKYTIGWASGEIFWEFFLGTINVCSPTGHCGRPAFNSSRALSSWRGVGDRLSPLVWDPSRHRIVALLLLQTNKQWLNFSIWFLSVVARAAVAKWSLDERSFRDRATTYTSMVGLTIQVSPKKKTSGITKRNFIR